VSQFERWYVTELLRTHDGNLSQAARSARMDRNHLRDLVRKHGVPR
jgi:DNA-binding NtrC family response regulator